MTIKAKGKGVARAIRGTASNYKKHSLCGSGPQFHNGTLTGPFGNETTTSKGQSAAIAFQNKRQVIVPRFAVLEKPSHSLGQPPSRCKEQAKQAKPEMAAM